jgi:subtilisin-like proprotein convertase family protein
MGIRRLASLALLCWLAGLGCGRLGYEPEAPTPCREVTCSGHGSCAALDGQPICVCDEGYYAEGLACLEYVVQNPCEGITCSGYGICAVRNGQALCVCAQGYHTPPDDRTNCVADVHPCDGEDGSPCDDGEFCTVDDVCLQGVCRGAPNPCEDGNPCTVDLCNALEGRCMHTAAPDLTPCDDQRYCTLGEVCLSGVCTDGYPRNCEDGNPCTQNTCDPALDACASAPIGDGDPCDDGAFCSVGETCQGGVCGFGALRDCQDENACTVDFCDESVKACVHEGGPLNGLPCDDGRFCTTGDTCLASVCAGTGLRSCNDGNPCTADRCDPLLDACAHDGSGTDGLACSDGRFCTVQDTCLGGACLGGPPNPCDDGNPCTSDACDPLLDECANDAALADGLACDDGAYCTVGEACSNGICVGGAPRDCADANPCTADACNEVIDQCTHTQVPDGTACNDGLFCTIQETCVGGSCAGGLARDCSDGNPCTADRCDEPTGRCLHDAGALNDQPCDDGNHCVVGERCQAGVCGGGAPRDCSDGNPCTIDVCNQAQARCDHDAAAMNGQACATASYCLVNTSCQAGVCGGGAVRTCDDGNPCTANVCNEGARRCDNPSLPNGAPCEDGLFCTAGDQCQAGACQPGSSDPCAADPCANVCNESTDSCGGCVPAGTYCASPVQAATCDGACNLVQLIICPYGCNQARNECNQCAPSSMECKGDAELLCNADHVCGPDGRLVSRTCCLTNQCTCDRAECLEDLCATAPDLGAGGTLSGTTCDHDDNIPGDCFPGGAACKSPAQGGAPEALFRVTLDDGTQASRFYTVNLDTAGSSLDTFLRLSTVCANEARQIPYAGVCHTPAPGTLPLTACTSGAGPDSARLCGLPEGEYFGAVDGPSGTCGPFNLQATVTQVNLDSPAQAGNISLGGTFTGSTCGLTDQACFPDTVLWSGSTCGDCTAVSGNALCPDCGVGAAADCTLPSGSNDDKCTYSGRNSPEAVFYLALPVDSGVDLSTQGSNFDTVLYLMQTGGFGPTPPGLKRICNDDCWTTNGPSHIQTSLAAGLYYVYLDGAGGACGNYVLRVVISPAATCGNLVCESPHETCVTCPQDCRCPHCGDGIIQSWEGEVCDDQNTNGGDCCSALCGLEPGCTCYGQPSICGVPTLRTYPRTCNCGIPDGTNTGPGTPRVDTLSVPVACTVAGLKVDMNVTHTYIGDLVITLRSPDGTTITLHNRSGGSNANIVGTYPDNLWVDGPGQLSDFHGQQAQGTWTLTAQDFVRYDAGTLNTWGLRLECL